jgi:hypothetical protein
VSTFMCRECGCAENTACCNYWDRHLSGKAVLCSACDPDIASWHGRFPQKSAAGMIVDQNGYLWSNAASIPKHYQIMGATSAIEPVGAERKAL